MGVTFAVGECVVFAMDGDPLLAALSRRQPEHRPKEQGRGRVHGQRPMRERAVQVDGRRDDRDLGQRNGDDRDAPDVSRQGSQVHKLAFAAVFLAKLVEAMHGLHRVSRETSRLMPRALAL